MKIWKTDILIRFGKVVQYEKLETIGKSKTKLNVEPAMDSWLKKLKKMKKRTWILSEYYHPYSENTTGYFVKNIADELAKKEKVISVFPYKSHLLNNKNRNIKVEISCIYPFPYNRNNLISKLFGHLIMSMQFFFFLLYKIKKGDTILCFTQPVFLVLVSSSLKKIKKIKTVVVIHDLFPESLIKPGIIKVNWLYRFILNVFNKSYQNFDKIITIGGSMTKLIQDKIPNYQSSIVTIPNWADINEIYFQEKIKNKIILKYNLESKVVFTFAGNIGRTQGINYLLRLIEQIEYNDNIHFLFIGKGVAINLLTQIVNENRKMVSYAGFFPEKDKNDFSNACDISIISLLEGMNGVSVPSKTYNILASGHPILYIGNEDSEIATLVKEHDVGWVCNPLNFNKFREIINEVLSNPIRIKIKGEKARLIAEKFYCKEKILSQYVSVFKKL